MLFLRCISKATALLCMVALLMSFVSVDSFVLLSSANTRSVTNSPSQSRYVHVANISRHQEIEIDSNNSWKLGPTHKNTITMITTVLATFIMMVQPSIVWADGQTKDFKFPPIDYGDKSRCILKGGSSMGQANAARDKLYDLRQCKLSGVDASGYDLSGVSKCTLYYVHKAVNHLYMHLLFY
jgi:hypothetical protein